MTVWSALRRYEGSIGAEQAMVPTEQCLRCVKWRGRIQTAPELELRGRFWCCPECGVSYGEHARPERVLA